MMDQITGSMGSRPSRARGLKQEQRRAVRALARSRPSRTRGLKQELSGVIGGVMSVAPLAGAWIETSVCCATKSFALRRAPRGRVD